MWHEGRVTPQRRRQLLLNEKDGEGNVVAYVDNVHAQRIAIIDP
jgi:hypothetical protein